MPAIPAIPPIGPTHPGEWSVGRIGAPDVATAPDAAAGTGSASFGNVLGKSLQSLADSQTDAAKASQSLADGTATDPSQVVMAVERARLAMQLAAQLRTKGVEAVNDIFHTQV
jgi:flagellar hook-basal body complex protein FliE